MKKTTIFFFLLMVSLPLVFIPSTTVRGDIAVIDENLKVTAGFTQTDKLRSSIIDTKIDADSFTVLNTIRNGENIVFNARAYYDVYLGFYTVYGIGDCFDYDLAKSASKPFLHEILRKYATMPSTELSDKWYSFDYKYYILGNPKPMGFTGNVPISCSYQASYPSLNNSLINIAGGSIVGSVASMQIVKSGIYDIGNYTDFVTNSSLTYMFTDLKSQTLSSYAAKINANGVNSFTNTAALTGSAIMEVKDLAVTRETSYVNRYLKTVNMQSVNAPTPIGYIENNQMYFTLTPDVKILNQKIEYDYWDRIVIGTQGYSWTDRSTGVYFPYSNGRADDKTIDQRIVGWSIQNKAHLYKMQVSVLLTANTTITAQNGRAVSLDMIPLVQLGNMFWDGQLSSGTIKTTLDTSTPADKFLIWLETYWWVIALIAVAVVAIYLFYPQIMFSLGQASTKIKL